MMTMMMTSVCAFHMSFSSFFKRKHKMSKKRKTTNVGRVVKNDVEANTHRRRLKINLGVIRVDFECKALNEEQRKQLQEHALKEETRSWVDKQNQNFYSFEGSILPLSELMQTFCLETRDAQKALGVSIYTYKDALKWYGIRKVTSSTAISIRNGEDCFSPEKKKEKGLAEGACPERTYAWFCLLSLEDRRYVNDQKAIDNRNREKLKNIETDVSDGNGGNLNKWQVDVRRNQRKHYSNSKKRREGIETDFSDRNGRKLNQWQVDSRRKYLKQYLKKKKVGFGFPKPFHGSECPLCRCSGSERWFSLPRLAKDFVTMGRETGNRNTAEEVISAWCEAEKGLTEEMFDSERPNLLRDLCLDCYYVQFATFAQAFGITRFSLPGRMRKNRKYPERSAVMMNARFNGN